MGEPFKPFQKTLPFLVYYTSRYRGICHGILVSRTVVMTAAVCVINTISLVPDTRPINVVTGSMYRHPRRGIRVQITKIIIPKMPLDLAKRAHLLQKSVALMIMKRKVPDILAENPLRSLEIDWKGEETLRLQEECLMPGWHFFYAGDRIYPVHKFLLQRNARVQFLNIVKMHEWCDALAIKLQKSLSNIGFYGLLDKTSMICTKDPDNSAQPCHGMYGSPLLCAGRGVGMLMAPDAQWTNCTGFSNIIHLFNSEFLSAFMQCVSKLFVVDTRVDWSAMKKAIYDEREEVYDYIPSMYDRVVDDPLSTSEEL
ncbi:uncharacterized protein LOC126380606 [Pectinophora gossypiella]|uniref:uncharacterized protein LOC126380606 n=1 Tax=Pectinophora gossypiella TaxID=13191 RepID=UPI00214F0BB7|nr:uncharacterized protein LOC126380606 [Pectinophora gossypiella]